MNLTMYTEALLKEAQDIWERGMPIPYDLAVKLQEEGIDYATLEAKQLEK